MANTTKTTGIITVKTSIFAKPAVVKPIVSTAANAAAIRTSLSQFKAYMTDAARNFKHACEVFYNAVTSMPEAREAFRKDNPGITDTVWNRMYMVGEGKVIPMLAIVGSPTIFEKLSKLTVSKQREIFAGKLPILAKPLAKDPRKHGITAKLVKDMHASELALVIKPCGGIRTISQQYAHVELVRAAKRAPQAPAHAAAWAVKGDTLCVDRKCTISRSMVVKILSDIDANIAMAKV